MEAQEGCYQMLKPLTFIETERKKKWTSNPVVLYYKGLKLLCLFFPKKIVFCIFLFRTRKSLGEDGYLT